MKVGVKNGKVTHRSLADVAEREFKWPISVHRSGMIYTLFSETVCP